MAGWGFDCMTQVTSAPTGYPYAAVKAGSYHGDEDVDLDDFVILKTNVGTAATEP